MECHIEICGGHYNNDTCAIEDAYFGGYRKLPDGFPPNWLKLLPTVEIPRKYGYYCGLDEVEKEWSWDEWECNFSMEKKITLGIVYDPYNFDDMFINTFIKCILIQKQKPWIHCSVAKVAPKTFRIGELTKEEWSLGKLKKAHFIVC